MTELTWSDSYLESESFARTSLDVRRQLTRQAVYGETEPAQQVEVAFAARTLELIALDLLQEDRTSAKTRSACARVFDFLRSGLGQAMGEPSWELLRFSCFGVLADKGSLARRLIHQFDFQLHPDAPDWGARVRSAIVSIWLLLIRKDGWKDLDALDAFLSDLRAAQREHEETYLDSDRESLHSAAFELIALYHLGRAAEIVAAYLVSGEVEGHFDPRQLAESHFDRAIGASAQGGLIELENLARLLSVTAAQLIDNSLWTASRRR